MLNREILAQIGCEDSVVLDPEYLDDAIIGYTQDGNVVYDYNKLIDAFCAGEKEWTREDAIEWIEYNTMRAIPYMASSGPAPIIMFDIEDYK